MDNLLINISDFTPYKDISENMDKDRVEQYIRDTQVIDIRGFLGKKLYLTLVNSYQAPTNDFDDPLMEALFFGEDKNGERFYGLKPMLIEYTYVRLIEDINISLTRTGVRAFSAEESEPVTDAVIVAKANTARSVALVYQEDVEDFLNANKSDYPLWAPTDIQQTGVKAFKLTP